MIYFLSSIPRSGSTLLTALLNQRTDTYVSTTSSLCDTMGSAITTWGSNPATHASGGIEEDGIRMLEAIANAHYADHSEPIIIDKGRGWPAPPIMSTMKKVQGDVKIIATVRPIRECLASFVKVANPNDVKDFCKNNELANHLFSTYHALKAGYEASPKNFLLIEYKDLVKDPQSQLDRIADFLDIERQECDPNNVKPVQEDDKIWGIKDLHKVRSKVGRRNYSGKKLLGKELWNFYVGGEFWSDKTEPKKKPNLLDLQLEASLRGDFEKGWELAQQLPEDDDRAAFNRGWYILRQGKLIEGHKLLDRGRDQDVFGNQFGSTQPMWNGESCGTVLLNLEGGLGDQVHGVRWAKDIASRGNKVVVACTADLAPLFVKVEGVSAIVQHEAGLGVYHNAWQPSMSAVIPLGYEYDDLDGQSYIPRFGTSKGKIGLRWSGNPKFEHEQHRLFPSELLFDAVKGHDCISLQRDEGSEFCPDWVERVLLDRWEDTAKAMSSCDLIITSCTSIAHLSGAMGIETWIVVPILSYYIWALPGSSTPYYNSVTLFRQETVENWTAPFDQIRERLSS